MIGWRFLTGNEFTESTSYAFHEAVHRRTSSNSSSVNFSYLHRRPWSFSRTSGRTSWMVLFLSAHRNLLVVYLYQEQKRFVCIWSIVISCKQGLEGLVPSPEEVQPFVLSPFPLYFLSHRLPVFIFFFPLCLVLNSLDNLLICHCPGNIFMTSFSEDLIVFPLDHLFHLYSSFDLCK